MSDLFDDEISSKIEICDGMWILRGFADSTALAEAIDGVVARAPLRHLITPGGFKMSVAMTSCGTYGWMSDRRGYRYDPVDPDSGRNWPAMPGSFASVATTAAKAAGYSGFEPDACLINQYAVGSQMTAHQDCNELDFSQPIVSVSLGISARFFVQGPERRGKSIPVDVKDGDVIVWGGPSRLFFHGVRPLKPDTHVRYGPFRYNLTFRRAK